MQWLTRENSKNHKGWYYPSSHRLSVNMLLNNITFLWFLLFSRCESLHVAVKTCINCSFFTFIFAVLLPQKFATYTICIEVLSLKHIWIATLFSGTRDIGHVTVCLPVGNFLWVFHWYWQSSSNGFRDIEAQMYLGHGFDLSRSCDVTGLCKLR